MKMILIVSDQVEEQDYPAIFEIQYLAFPEEPTIVALYPGGLEPASFAQNVVRFKEGLRLGDLNVVIVKVTDSETGSICAFLIVRLFDRNPFTGTNLSDIRLLDVDDENRPWLECLFEQKSDRKKEVLELQDSSSYAYLLALGTHPKCQREGAATLLMKWATDLADQKGMKCVLEAGASSAEYGLYRKHGFRTVDKYTYVDKEHFPATGSVYLETMVRNPIVVSLTHC